MTVSPSWACRPTAEAAPAGARPATPILVIDDNAAKRLALKATLWPLGYDIVEADSGVAALRHVMAQDFAVILLDVRMPLMDGFETAALIRQRRQSEMTPIIFVTAYAGDEIQNTDRYAEGAVDFMCAPVDAEELRAKVSVFANIFRNARLLAARAGEVQASADQLRLLTDAAPIGIFQTDAENRYVYTNPRWSEITGVGAQAALGQGWETLGQDWESIMGGEPGDAAEVPGGIPGRSELSHRFKLPPGPGGSRIVLVTSKSIPAGDGGVAGWVGTLADVTAEAGAEAAMSEARDEATAASRLKSDFLANMSHEIRTPMNGVIGMTDLLLETDLDVRQRDYAQTVRNSGEALMTIINDILDFSKVEAGMLELEYVEFSPRTIVDDVVDLLAGPAQAKGLDVIVVIAESVPVTVIGDPGRVRQVLTNLIGNAVKFTQTGEVVIRIPEPVRVGPETLMRVEVSDTGDGIAADKLASIFQPFVQADTSTSRKYGGTGLGLAICGQLVALMGGELGVASQLGTGSDFWFTIRVHPELAGGATYERPAPDAGLAGLAGLAALVVDDDASQREVVRDYLTGWGMTVDTAASEEAAAAALCSAAADGRPFGVVLTDRPLLWTCSRACGAEGSRSAVTPPGDVHLAIPIVLMTSLAEKPAVAGTARSGARASVSKPVRREVLGESLRTALGLPGPDGVALAMASRRRRRIARGTAGRLLLAEDNLINQKVALAMLSSAGYRVDTVLNGAAAVEAVGARPYDAILMDCQMPEMNGYEATAAIRAHEGSDRHTPIIAMTAGARREDRDRCLAQGMDGYLAKPVSKDALMALVGRWVKTGSGPRAGGAAGSVGEENLAVARSSAALDVDETVGGGDRVSGRSVPFGPSPCTGAPADPHGQPAMGAAERSGGGGADCGAPPNGDRDLIAEAVVAELDALEGDLLPGLVILFFDEAAALVSGLGLAFDHGEALTVSEAAHKLKGASATIGAARVSQIAAMIETTARASDLTGAGKLIDCLGRALAQTEEAFTCRAVAVAGRGETASG